MSTAKRDERIARTLRISCDLLAAFPGMGAGFALQVTRFVLDAGAHDTMVEALEVVERWLVKDMQARGFERSPILEETVRPALATIRGEPS